MGTARLINKVSSNIIHKNWKLKTTQMHLNILAKKKDISWYIYAVG